MTQPIAASRPLVTMRNLAVAVTFIVTLFIFRFTTSRTERAESVMPPTQKNVGPTLPPEPMLQGVPGHVNDPQQDLRDKIAADEKANQSYGPVNTATGTAQIPVDEAMKIIVSKGLPSVSEQKK